VVGVIYEARPNVSVDVFSLCFKSANACVLKGGHDADSSNRTLVGIIRSVISDCGLNPDVATLLPTDREATAQLLTARGLVDLIIPRGSRRLIESVRDNARIPVIETGAGVCHCYIDAKADTAMAAAIVNNAKTRRVSVCNALDCMIINSQRLSDLPTICQALANSRVIIHADAPAYAALEGHYPAQWLLRATDDDFGTEYLDYAMAIKTVNNVDSAIDHIAHYGSGHSEAIVTDDTDAADKFQMLVDAACVYVNSPTSFTDGAQFGLGAEIGISTQKLHARGPMALRELCTYKWLINGQGQTRP
jgi:glutamate-5-semialdehyde dehydrogenase